MHTNQQHLAKGGRYCLLVLSLSLFGAAVSQAQFLPDLVVVDLWESGGQVYFTLENIGTKTALANHTAGLRVDGMSVDSVVITNTIAPGDTLTENFAKYYWKCTADGTHSVVVTADVKQQVPELNEKNNSRQESWVCDVSPPKITVGPVAMYITQTSAKISWTTDENSDSVVRYGTSSTLYKYTTSSQMPTTDHNIFLDGLLSDTRYYYVVESADNAGNAVRSTEHSFRTLAEQIDLPDLHIPDIWPEDDRVYFRIENSGNAIAPAGHVATLFVDEQPKASRSVGSPLAPGSSLALSFKYTWTCTKPQHTVRVEADSGAVIEEENEQNNSREETWTCDVWGLRILSGPDVADISQTEAKIIWTTNQPSDSKVRYGTAPGVYAKEDSDATPTTSHELRLESLTPGTVYYFVVESQNQSGTVASAEESFQTDVAEFLLPDLVIDSIWQLNHQVQCRVKNTGDGTAPPDHRAGLYTDSHLVDSAAIGIPLAPGETADVVFRKLYFTCREPEQTFRAAADIDDRIFERDEANNSLERTFVCDATPLEIIAGPFVLAIDMTSADIAWDTNRAADSKVLYDSHAGLFGFDQGDGEQTTKHAVHLQHLTPGTSYQFRVQSTDDGGQSVQSKPGYFRTPSKGDGQSPKISEVTFVRQPTAFLCYTMTAVTDEGAEPEKVEFFLDGNRIHTDYAPPFQAVITPGLIGIARGEFFRPRPVEAVATTAGVLSDRCQGVFQAAYECNEVFAEFEWPFRNETFYVPGEVAPAGTEIPIRVHAYTWDALLITADGIEHMPDVPDFMVDFQDFPLEEVRFYFNGAHIGTVPSQTDHIYDLVWDADSMPVGTHVIRADAIANDQCIQTITRDIELEQGEPEIRATRQVWREGNAFRIRLNIRNVGTVSYHCSMIYDNVDGLQPIEDAYDDYRILTTPSLDGRHCDVTLDLFSSGSNAYEIRPSRTVSVEYYAIPIQFPGPGSPKYEIGEDPVEIVDASGLDEWTISCPCVRTEDGHLLDEEIDWAIEGSDYQLVTNPERCDSEFGGAASLLSEIARLAYHRNGILGYPSGIASDDPVWVFDCIRMWGSAMTGSDGIANHYLSNGYLLLVGETEILPSWTVDVADIDWRSGARTAEVGYSDLPYGDTLSADNVPELSVGRIIGDTAGALMQAIQSSLYSTFDRSYGVVTSGSEGDWENFVGNARAIVDTWIAQAAGGEIMTEETKAHHWSAYIHKEQINNGHDFPTDPGDGFVTGVLAGYGMSAVRVDPDTDTAYVAAAGDLGLISTTFAGEFILPFDSGDALAAGDLDADGEDEIIVGAIAEGKLLVACDPPNTTSRTYLEFDADLEPWDVIACGRLFDLMATEQVVVARPTDGGTVDIYEYASLPLGLVRTWRLDIPFSAYDGLAIADVDPNNPGDEILIGSDGDQRIYVYDRRGNPLMEIPCEPYTAFDSLVAGDMDNDGADELALLIDDVIDSKRRVHIFEDGCVALDPNEGWQLVRGRSRMIYSRFLHCEGARTTGSSTGYDGVTCDDLDGDGKQEICLAREHSDRLYVLDGHYSRGWKDRYLPVLQSDDDLIDLFMLSGHGSPGSCSPFDLRDVRTLNLTAGPLVFALSCLTGNYEGEWWQYDETGAVDAHSDGDDGFAETFLGQGAAAYVGATEVSGSCSNAAAGPAFLSQWDVGIPAGKAYANFRRDRAATGDNGWKYWALEYNYYGDPKLGAADVGVAAASAAGHGPSIASAASIPSDQQIQIPDYEVTTVDGQDHVVIPGGDMLLEDGRPMVPIFRQEWTVPPSTVVQDVHVRDRGGLRTDVGLRLPVALMMPDASATTAAGAGPAPGWYPNRELDWRIVPGAEGASTLVVTLYPFDYDAVTTESRFHQLYELAIETLDSRVRITALLTDSQVYALGDLVTIKLGLSAAGEPEDAFVETVVRQYGSDVLVAGLLLSNLTELLGSASYATVWDSHDATSGLYYAETKIIDPAGQILARETARFKLVPQE